MFPQYSQTPNSRKRTVCASYVLEQQQTADGCVRLTKRRQISSPFISQNGCVVCLETGLQLVQLGSCGHAVCRSCMTSALLHAFKLQQLPLRCPLPHCKAQLQLQPAVQLLEQQVPGSSAIAAKVLVAAAADLALIPHHLRCLCPYADCQVPLEFPADPLPDVPLDCPSCQRAVCSTCRSKWHSGLTCAQHQSLVVTNKQLGVNKQQDQQQQHGTCLVAKGAGATLDDNGSSMLSWQQGSQGGALQQVQRQGHWHHGYSSLRTYEGYGQSVARQSQPQQQQQSGGADAMMWSPGKGSGVQ